jgi:mono/diheme cytochrome c family protein
VKLQPILRAALAVAVVAAGVNAKAQTPQNQTPQNQAPQSGDSGGGVVRVARPVTGEEVYRTVCQACHMADANGGAGAAVIPALANNPRLGVAAYPIIVVTRGKGAMPGLRGTLDDEQIAGAITYVRTHFGNSFEKPVTAADVARVGGPPAAGGH